MNHAHPGSSRRVALRPRAAEHECAPPKRDAPPSFLSFPPIHPSFIDDGVSCLHQPTRRPFWPVVDVAIGLGPAHLLERVIVIDLAHRVERGVWGSNMVPALINAIRDPGDGRRSTNNGASSPRLTLLRRRRGKLLARLLSHKLPPARKARLRQMLANIDEVIRLLKGPA